MTDPTDVLARIDSTIEAWELGPDAARWRPGPPQLQQEQLAAACEALARRITEQWTAAQPALVAAFDQIIKNVTAAGLALQKLGFAIQIRNGARSCPHRSFYEACDFCYPAPFPAARDYRRRTKHRNRRRR